MALSDAGATRKQQVLSILGMAMVWPSIHNQVLYPLTFSFHKDGALSPYGFYLLYSLVMLATVGALVLMNRKGLTQRLFANAGAMAAVGLMGAAGLGLLVACDFGNALARWFMGAGVAFAAVFVPIYFMFWSVQLAYASQRRAAFDLILSYLVFALVTLGRLTFELHAWLFSIAYPLVSMALALAVLRTPAKGKFALGTTPLTGLPLHLLVPAIVFVYLATATRCLLNPINAAFDYPPFHRVFIYVILAALAALLAVLYRPHGKLKRNADLLSFSLVAVFLIGAILLTGIGLLDDTPLGNLPTIAGINITELFIWLVVLANAQIKHAGIVRPAAVFLVFVVGASHLASVLVLGGVSWLQFDVSQLPLIAITVSLAFLVVAVVMAVLAIMLYNAHAQAPAVPFPVMVATQQPASGRGDSDVTGASGTSAAGQTEAALRTEDAGRGAGAGARAATAPRSAAPGTPATGVPLGNEAAMPPCFTMAADEAAITRIQESFGLSKRETDTLRLAARSKSAKEIAESLFVAESTVNSHIKGIYRKCDVHSRQELIALVNRFKREQGR